MHTGIELSIFIFHDVVITSFIFSEKYDYIGRLLKPGEQPQDYTDTEEEPCSTEKKD